MRNFWRTIQFNPAWKSLSEVTISAFFTFFPIFILSVPLSQESGEFTGNRIFQNFYSFWNSGEIVLPVLGLVGTIIAFVATNRRAIHSFLFYFAVCIPVSGALAGGYILSESNGFSKVLYSEIIFTCFLGYFVLLSLQFIISFKIQSSASKEDSEERANKLLKQKHELEN